MKVPVPSVTSLYALFNLKVIGNSPGGIEVFSHSPIKYPYAPPPLHIHYDFFALFLHTTPWLFNNFLCNKSKIVYCISKDQQKAHIQYLRVDITVTVSILQPHVAKYTITSISICRCKRLKLIQNSRLNSAAHSTTSSKCSLLQKYIHI